MNLVDNYEQEVWKRVSQEFCNKEVYISNLGRLKRVLKSKDIITKGSYDVGGYLRVYLSNGSKSKTYKMHRLVCYHFIDSNIEGLTVNHKNFIKDDNRVSNLELISDSENVLHYMKNKVKIKSSSKVLYVFFHKSSNKWGFQADNKTYTYFETELDAEKGLLAYNNGTFVPKTSKDFTFENKKDLILDSLYLLKNGFMKKQITQLLGVFNTSIDIYLKNYKNKLPENYTPKLLDMSKVVKEVLHIKTGKECATYKERVGRSFTNRRGDTYTIIRELDDICDIQFQCGKIIKGLHWERVRRSRVLNK